MDSQNVPEYFDDCDEDISYLPESYGPNKLHSSSMYDEPGEMQHRRIVGGLANYGGLVVCIVGFLVASALISGAMYLIVNYVHIFPKG